ncbi:MAG: response regulator [Lachnospiraceae bacterium]|nr:response regulator [Lachnospiraceae bacterium]
MRNKILVVDDMLFNRQILRNILKDDYEILEAENGRVALDMLEKHYDNLVAVLLDIVMPEMDGIQVLQVMVEKNYVDRLPVLMVTGEQDIHLVEKCFDYGIADFIKKPFEGKMIKKRVNKIVNLYLQKDEYKSKYEQQMVALRNQYKLLQSQAEKLKKSNENMIYTMGSLVEYRNMESEHSNHILNVQRLTGVLAEHLMKAYPEYGLTKDVIKTIVSASALHDVGKIAIPDSILLKPGKLTSQEFDYIKSHTIRGEVIIRSISELWEKEYVHYSLEICRHHHERYDGSGYPDGLKGEEIPISAQLVSLADVYDGLTGERIYKEAFSLEEAYNMILQGECGIFSPKLMECFRHAKTELEACVKAKDGEAATDEKENP